MWLTILKAQMKRLLLKLEWFLSMETQAFNDIVQTASIDLNGWTSALTVGNKNWETPIFKIDDACWQPPVGYTDTPALTRDRPRSKLLGGQGHTFQAWRSSGAWIAQWLERQTRDRKVVGSSSSWSGGRISFSRVNVFCADSYFGIRSTPVLPQYST